MMKRLRYWGFALGVAAMCVALSGCVFLVAGGIGAVGGYAVTRDTVQGEYDANYSKAVKTADKVCEILGAIVGTEEGNGVILASVDGANVRVEITQLTPETIRLKVKARKGIFPRVATAEKVFIKIIQQLK